MTDPRKMYDALRPRTAKSSPEPFDVFQELISGQLAAVHTVFKALPDDDVELRMRYEDSGIIEEFYDDEMDAMVTTRWDFNYDEYRTKHTFFRDHLRRLYATALAQIVTRYSVDLRKLSSREDAEWLFKHDVGRVDNMLAQLYAASDMPGGKHLSDVLEKLKSELIHRTPWMRRGKSTQRPGRPLDLSIPQDRIVELVRDALDVEKNFKVDKSGRRVPFQAEIIRYVERNDPDVFGDAKPRTVQERIKKALDEILGPDWH